MKVTGSCVCKVLVVMYLLTCLLISALYIALYGPNELYITPDAPHLDHNPSKPTVPSLPPTQFQDNPYTEWLSQRWIYDIDTEYSDWPLLPEYIQCVRQVAHGHIHDDEGVWLLDSEALYFVRGLGESVEKVEFVDISTSLGVNISDQSYMVVRDRESLYVLSSGMAYLIACYDEQNNLCNISHVWNIPLYSDILSGVISSNGYLWIGTRTGLYRLNTTLPAHENTTSLVRISNVEGSVISLAWRASLIGQKGWGLSTTAFLLTDSAYLLKQDVSYHTSGYTYKGQRDAPGFGLLVIGTESRIYFYDGKMLWFEWVSVWEEGLGGVVDGTPMSFTFVPSGELYIGNNVSLSRLNVNYTFDRIGPLQGLPYDHITSLYYMPYVLLDPLPMATGQLATGNRGSSAGGVLWVGTEKGCGLYDVGEGRFLKYFHGPRWLPGDSVWGMSGRGKRKVVMVTDGGLAVFRAEEWTLKKKALHYQEMLERHTREPGLVADCPLLNYSTLSCSPQPTANDGLWTAWAVASEAFRYQVMGNESIRESAWSLIKGMQFLLEATGVNGLPARSVSRCDPEDYDDDDSVDGDWYNSSTSPGWMWLGDTSSDEIVGHIFAYTIAYDLIATTESERNSITHSLDSIMNYIMSNNFTLIDVTNEPTRWGVWSPNQINLNQSWADERGLNSLEILTGLLSAYRLTDDIKYYNAWQELFNGSMGSDPNHYGLNMINQKITFPRDENYSDNELAFLPYLAYFYNLKMLSQKVKLFERSEVSYIPLLSLRRAWNDVKRERSAPWTAIYSYATGDRSHKLVEDIVWNLRTWPLELIQWQTTNSHRLDITFNKEQDRNFRCRSQSVGVLPANERTQLRWNGNPYQLDWAGSSSETDPSPWLMSYWLARWVELL